MNFTISKGQAQKAATWLKKNFGKDIAADVAGTPWTVDIITGIACQETAYKWLSWVDKFDPATILQRCVFDASGDFPGTSRKAFPVNRQAFEAKYGKDFTDMLVAEGNKQRAMPQVDAPGGYKPAGYLYKGYGIFQNDLQNVVANPSFFLEKKWYNISDCVAGVVKELNGKARTHETLPEVIQAYNGSGPKAQEYSRNVMQFISWSASV